MRRPAAFALALGWCGLIAAQAGQAVHRWSPADVGELQAAIARSADEGLDPADYGAASLQAALRTGAAGLDGLADHAALALARDFREGRDRTPGWHFARPAFDYAAWLRGSLDRHRIGAALEALLPTDARYAGLRAAFGSCRAASGDCRTIRANLDRWRRLPRRLGSRFVWVNIPAMRADLIEDGTLVTSHRVIVGKRSTRTPFFAAVITAVTVNPWWSVPCSIVDESIGRLVRTHPREAARRGFVAKRDGQGKLIVRQRPGPDNALGRIKLEMPNPYGVYLHDTPTRDLFARDERALSHGCIRTEAPDVLARHLLAPADAASLPELLASGASRTIALPAPVPIYVVYLTAEADSRTGGQLLTFADVYGQDRLAARAVLAP